MSDYCTDADCPAPSHNTYSAYHYGCRSGAAKLDNRRYYKRMKAGINPSRYTDSLGTARRLQALAAIGWDARTLAPRLGVRRQALQAQRRPVSSRVNVATAEKIAALYDELHMLPGPAARARTDAARRGWAPPLAWNDIDDPDEVPQLGAPVDAVADENVVRAFVANRPPRWGRMTEADRELLVRELRRLGYTRNAIALATHASHQQVRRWWEKVAG